MQRAKRPIIITYKPVVVWIRYTRIARASIKLQLGIIQLLRASLRIHIYITDETALIGLCVPIRMMERNIVNALYLDTCAAYARTYTDAKSSYRYIRL